MNVMTRAWEIARSGQKKFGGTVKEYFAFALRMAWAEAKGSIFEETEIAERIIIVADHDKKEYSVTGEKNGKVFWKQDGIAATDRTKYTNSYGHLYINFGIRIVSFYVIKDNRKRFLETKEVA